MTTSQVLRTLESKGRVERTRDPGDSRARDVGVTEEGARPAARATGAVAAADAAFFGSVPDRQKVPAVLRALAG